MTLLKEDDHSFESDLTRAYDSTKHLLMHFIKKGLAIAYGEQRQARELVREEFDRLRKIQDELMRHNQARLNLTRKYLKSHNLPLLPAIF